MREAPEGNEPAVQLTWAVRAVAVIALMVVGTAACADVREGAVAVASDAVLTVDEVVDLLVDLPDLPANEGVVRALADLWIDYTLLGEAAREDPTLASLDLSSVVVPRVEQEMIRDLRRSVIQVDTVLADDELRYLFDRDQPGARVKARHILLTYDMTRDASRDSAIAMAEDLRDRVRGGADFAALAREYSRDLGTARLGGDLGEPFPPERMVAPFSEAAFALAPGEVSDPVLTQFGVHVIRVDRREAPDFEEVKESFRNAIKNQRVQFAESTYVSTLEGSASPTVLPDAYGRVRELAREPAQRLTRRGRDAPLVEYQGGAYTAGEFQGYARTRTPAVRGEITMAGDEDLEEMLLGLTRGELLVTQAREAGLAPPQVAVDSLETAARAQFEEAVAALGLASDGATSTIEILSAMLTGERDVIPLGPVGYVLRERYEGRLIDAGVEQALERLTEARRAVAPPLPTPPADESPDADPADTLGPAP